jgi:hypothetical protein|nr:MAG TPA: hypothetical protein [Caudoviricetes sp.]
MAEKKDCIFNRADGKKKSANSIRAVRYAMRQEC